MADDVDQATAELDLHSWVGIVGTDREGFVTAITDDTVSVRTLQHIWDQRDFSVPRELVELRPEPGLVQAAAEVKVLLDENFDDLDKFDGLDVLITDIVRKVLDAHRSSVPGRDR